MMDVDAVGGGHVGNYSSFDVEWIKLNRASSQANRHMLSYLVADDSAAGLISIA
jgi:hypothetical protein